MKMTEPLRKIIQVLPVLFFLILLLCPFGNHSLAEEENPNYHAPEGLYIKMTREFYEALKEDSNSGLKTYSNNASLLYLKQISINSRFMVETNLQIIKQQEQILFLLQTLLDDKKK